MTRQVLGLIAKWERSIALLEAAPAGSPEQLQARTLRVCRDDLLRVCRDDLMTKRAKTGARAS